MDTSTRAPLILIGNIIPFVVGSIFWAGRVYSRAAILHTWGADDWLLVTGWAAALVNCVLACLGTRYGAGMHVANVAASDLVPATKISFGTLIVYQASLCFTKLSVVTLYLRVFTTSRSGRLQLFGAVGFLVALNVASECVSIFQCDPVQDVWKFSDEPRNCINTIPMFYLYSVANILVDGFLMLFAIPRILGLKMATRQKYALLATIAMGGVPIIASIIRCVRVSEILTSTDPTWKSYDSSIWSAVDANVSIICASIPSLKPLLRQIAPKFVGSTLSTQQGHSKSWMASNWTGEKGFELRDSPNPGLFQNSSQTELARGAQGGDWLSSSGTKNATDNEVVSEGESLNDEPGIMKSTQFVVSYTPSS